MARRTMRRRRHSRRRESPSTSIVTQTSLVDLSVSNPNTDETYLETQSLGQVENESGETVNRKILRVVGELMFTSNLPANQLAVAMFALRASPSLDPWPAVSDFDPFDSGPDGSASYKGRPSPRPFGRRNFALVTPAGSGVVQTIENAFRYHSRAERLLRPGWRLQAGLYVRVRTSGNVHVRIGGILRTTIAG